MAICLGKTTALSLLADFISEILILKPTAIINGDIVTNKLVVENGAQFNGSCKMGAIIKDITIGEKEEAKKQRTA